MVDGLKMNGIIVFSLNIVHMQTLIYMDTLTMNTITQPYPYNHLREIEPNVSQRRI